ncbi:MAG: undecaprenyl-diphosphate phosphatase [Clostridiales bacterium]|nr:undecaprenyl-diphosphate phosphatase [Clostridiales bacterium]
MQVIYSAIMGLVQGLTEFLPVSSSGHLLLAEKLLGLLGYQNANSMALAVMLHMGTLIAVAVIFWRDWIEMLRHPIKNPTLLLLFVASLPALVLVVLLGDWIDGLFTGWFLGISFFVTALFLVLIERISGKRKGSPVVNDAVTMPRAVIMGLFQGIALLPGVSRSGSTLLGGVSTGLSRGTAAKFSFMMSAPAILGSFLKEGKDAIEAGGLSSLISVETLVGVVVAAVSGWLAIRYMLKLIERISFYKFALYVALVGAAVIVMQLTGFAGFPPLAWPGAAPQPLG